MTLPMQQGWRGALVALLLFGAATPFAMAQDLRFTPHHADGHYATGQTVGWAVTLAPAATPRRGSYSYTIVWNDKAQVETGSFAMTSRHADIVFKADRPGVFQVVVDYLAPPLPKPPSPAEIKQINKGVRVLLIRSDPAIKPILDKYPDYQFIHRSRFNFRMFMEDRVATLHAVVAGKP